jgi:hypothetical protein
VRSTYESTRLALAVTATTLASDSWRVDQGDVRIIGQMTVGGSFDGDKGIKTGPFPVLVPIAPVWRVCLLSVGCPGAVLPISRPRHSAADSALARAAMTDEVNHPVSVVSSSL